MNSSPAQVVGMMMQFITELGEAQNAYDKAVHIEVDLHREFITEQAAAWREVQGPNREYREAMVDDATKDRRHQYESAQADTKVAYQRVLSKRQALSALQSAARSVTEEMGFSRTAPNVEGLYTERYG